MRFKVSKSSAHITAKATFGSGSLLTPSGLFKKTFCTFFGSTVSHLVLPAQHLSSDKQFIEDTMSIEQDFENRVNKESELDMAYHIVDCFDGSSLETMELRHNEQLSKPSSEQQYIIYLVGNGMCMQDIYNEVYSQCLATKHNMVTFNFKNVLRSQGKIHHELDLINDIISQIERLKDIGIQTENICLVGHSLGAAFATLASYVYLKEGTPIKVFNGRSFSNFARMSYLQEKNQGHALKAMFKKMIFSLSNFEIEVARYYDLLPDDYKDYITVEESDLNSEKKGVPDGVIPPEASLRRAIKDQDSRHTVRSTSMMGWGHNEPLHTLECYDSGKTADEQCREFILK